MVLIKNSEAEKIQQELNITYVEALLILRKRSKNKKGGF